jgi:F-type H+-transporting ATPase subunit delta
MAENVTLARPYAEAAFQLAAGSNALSAWSTALNRLAAVTANPEMEDCIGNPLLAPEQLTRLCLDVAGDALSAQQQDFVRVLVDNDRLTVLPEIAELFEDLKAGHEGVKHAEISSAFALDDAALKNLVADLERRFGCKIDATVSLDPELIGGVRIAVGDEVIDASVRGKLAAMATALKN